MAAPALNSPTSSQDMASILSQLYGSDNRGAIDPNIGIINQAYGSLNQPLTDKYEQRGQVTQQFITGLAQSYVDQYHKQTGNLPSPEQVQAFVGQNATTSNAAKFIQGTYTPSQMSNDALDHIKSNPSADDPNNPVNAINGLSGQLDKAYEAGKQNLVTGYDANVYNPAKTGTVNDLGGQGLLTQPNSRFTLDKIESNRGRDITSGLNSLEATRASGQVDLGKKIADLLQEQEKIGNQNTQFNKTLGFNQDVAQNQLGMQYKQMDLAERLGKMQADAAEPGWGDKVLAGFAAVSPLVGAGTTAYYAGKKDK
jgi:hypothetical protein